ncbi:Cell growth-regulating nucleolar protein [Orchesella cincta]|uniref:Cell growth-regulating nucleolar protein n=1 Tax=Orchesella cincta TaxID=48709 RepID=A0A1D2NFZ6_ORCCI|nr:Cell growth-regulating nucleolar protein [Orchesella cincta]
MVFFTCDSCGTALKKAQVEQHMYSCGKVVSCIDCLKEFRGNEFKAHTKCISEEEKYNGPDWKAPSSRNKGEKKQMAWVETVNAVLESGKNKLTPSQMGLLKIIAKHDNVPRKKPKFLNFIRNIAKNSFDQYTQEAVFDCLEAEWKSQAEKNKPEAPATNGKKDEAATNGKDKEDAEENGVQNGEENGKKKKSKKNKRKLEENEENMDVEVKKKKKKKGAENDEEEDNNADESQTEETEVPAEFRWGEIIEEILMAREDKSISLKKLKKKVFSEYYARVGDSKGVKSKEDLSAQLNKKLRKRKFQVVGETVKLTNVEGE